MVTMGVGPVRSVLLLFAQIQQAEQPQLTKYLVLIPASYLKLRFNQF